MIYCFNNFVLKLYLLLPECVRKGSLLEAEVPKAGLFFYFVCLTVGLIVNLSDYKDGVLLLTRISVCFTK